MVVKKSAEQLSTRDSRIPRRFQRLDGICIFVRTYRFASLPYCSGRLYAAKATLTTVVNAFVRRNITEQLALRKASSSE